MKMQAEGKAILRQCFIATDNVVFSALIAYSLCQVLHVSDRISAFLLFLLLILILLFAIRRIGNRRKETERRKDDERRKRTESLLLTSDEEIGNKVGEVRFVLIRKLSPDWCDVLEAIRNGASAIGILKNVQNAKDILQSYAPDTKLYDTKELMQAVFPEYVFENRSPSRFKKQIQRIASNKYLLLGLLLLIASLWTNQKLYFRLLSESCFLIGGLSVYFSSRKQIKTILEKRE